MLDSGKTSLLDNDSDPENHTLTVTATPRIAPSNGNVTLSGDGTFSYTHDGGPSSGDSFQYEACDSGSPSKCDTATVVVTVGCTLPISMIKANWNLLGWACDQPGDPNQIARDLGVLSPSGADGSASGTGGTLRILGWDPATQGFTTSFRSDRPFNTLTELTKWNGYWVYLGP